MVFLPFKDDNPRHYIKFYYVTAGLILANLLVFVWQLGLGEGDFQVALVTLGMVPQVLTGDLTLPSDLAVVPPAASLLTYMFLHGGWGHLAGNMLFLWVFGDNVEDALGHGKFLLFYLLCGVVAALVQFASAPGETTPIVGASGAVAGVLGAYLLLHPKVKVWTFAFVPIPFKLPTIFVLGGWIALNVINAMAAGEQGVAWWAHVGGFAAGMLLVGMMKRKELVLLDWDNRNNEPAVKRRVIFPESGRKRK